MSRMMRLSCLLLLFALLIFMNGRIAEAELKYIGVREGDPAPDFSLATIDGQSFTLSSFRGKKVVLLDFWATWCNVCKKELPTINKDYKKYRQRGYEVLSIVLNANDMEGIRRVKEEKAIEFPILLDSKWDVSKLYGLEGPIPVMVVIDAKGIVRFTHFGEFPAGENEIPYVVEALLGEMPKGNASPQGTRGREKNAE
ncbi:TlpA family protein disulfide reductase [Candidatus Poribacteria bacterium]|nr:TlpA family protein disulfide reductase [Candidatus Poribacteria bacterium]